jgi:hypothetical protein
VWTCQPTIPTLDRARCQLSHVSSVFSLPPLHDFDDTWTSPTLVTSTADRAQQHAPLHLLVFMILLISTTDPDNAHTSTNDQKVGHRSPIPSPTPHPPVFACGGQALWTPANTSHALRRVVWNSVIGRAHMDFHGICFFAHYTLLLVHEVECIPGDYYAHGGVRFDSFAIFYFPPERAWQQKLLWFETIPLDSVAMEIMFVPSQWSVMSSCPYRRWCFIHAESATGLRMHDIKSPTGVQTSLTSQE